MKYPIEAANVERLEACPVCAGADFRSLCETRVGKLNILETALCSTCGFVFRVQRPDSMWFESAWRMRDEISDPATYAPDRPSEKRRYSRYSALAQALEEVGCRKQVIDIGTGPGTGLRAFRDRGWEVAGLEPDPSRARIGRDLHGLDVIPQSVEAFAHRGSPFAVATLIHVLEHAHDPESFLGTVARCVVPGGFIYVEVPELHEFVGWRDALHLEHMSNFSEHSLCRMAGGLDLIPRHRFYPRTQPRGAVHLGILFQKKSRGEKAPDLGPARDEWSDVVRLYQMGHPCKRSVEPPLTYTVPFVNDICRTYVDRKQVLYFSQAGSTYVFATPASDFRSLRRTVRKQVRRLPRRVWRRVRGWASGEPRRPEPDFAPLRHRPFDPGAPG